jgi:hypothetical protein
MAIEYTYTTGSLSVTVMIESYTVERYNASMHKDYEVECYYVEDVFHKGESISALISEETAEEILYAWKQEVKNGDN